MLIESEPYRVFNNKKYGRKSQPRTGNSFEDGLQSDGDLDIASKRKKSSEHSQNTSKALIRRSSSRVCTFIVINFTAVLFIYDLLNDFTQFIGNLLLNAADISRQHKVVPIIN